MLKNIFTRYPLWFMIIWSCVIIGFIIIFITGIDLTLMMGGLVVLYTANAIRAWKDERMMAIISFVTAAAFAAAGIVLL